MGWCPRIIRMPVLLSGLFEKDVKDSCCIDIKTKADKREEG